MHVPTVGSCSAGQEHAWEDGLPGSREQGALRFVRTSPCPQTFRSAHTYNAKTSRAQNTPKGLLVLTCHQRTAGVVPSAAGGLVHWLGNAQAGQPTKHTFDIFKPVHLGLALDLGLTEHHHCAGLTVWLPQCYIPAHGDTTEHMWAVKTTKECNYTVIKHNELAGLGLPRVLPRARSNVSSQVHATEHLMMNLKASDFEPRNTTDVSQPFHACIRLPEPRPYIIGENHPELMASAPSKDMVPTLLQNSALVPSCVSNQPANSCPTQITSWLSCLLHTLLSSPCDTHNS